MGQVGAAQDYSNTIIQSMLVMHEPIPTLRFNVVRNYDCSNECTIVASNASFPEGANNLVSDNGAASTQLSTDIESISNVEHANTELRVSSYHNTHYLGEANPTTKLRLSGSK